MQRGKKEVFRKAKGWIQETSEFIRQNAMLAKLKTARVAKSQIDHMAQGKTDEFSELILLGIWVQIHWAPGLPKTRSGKIMRRVLRKIASNQTEELGDLSTLAEPGVVQQLIELRGK